MSGAEKITIEEWAGDNNLLLTEDQIEELCDGLDAAHDMNLYSAGWTPGHPAKTVQDDRIEELEGMIRQYEGFLKEKGYAGLTCYPDKIRHWHMVNYSDWDRSSSREDTYRY